jgi:regulator of replication initiation timing
MKVAWYARVGNMKQLDTITVTEAGKLLSKTKEEIKQFVEENGLIKIGNSDYRYVLLKNEILKYKK